LEGDGLFGDEFRNHDRVADHLFAVDLEGAATADDELPVYAQIAQLLLNLGFETGLVVAVPGGNEMRGEGDARDQALGFGNTDS